MSDMIERLTDPVLFWAKSWHDHCVRNPEMPGYASVALLRKRVREKLDRADRERVAIGLHVESTRIAQSGSKGKPFSNAAWMTAAGLAIDPTNPTKRLNEYVLPPYDPKNVDAWEERASRLVVGARGYLQLIEALLGFTEEGHDALLGRIFAGSSFASGAAEVARYGRLAAGLAELVAQTDKMVARVQPGTSLARTFAHTAEVKAELIRARSPMAWWPYFAPFESPLPGAVLPDPYWDLTHEFPYGAADPSQAAYRRMAMPPLDWLHGLMYLPRAYLGCAARVLDWVDAPKEQPEKVGKLFAELYTCQSTLMEVRNPHSEEVRCDALDALSDLNSSQLEEGLPRIARDIGEEGHCWLVIYPARGRAGLCPLFYWSLGEGGVHVCQLDEMGMHALSQILLPSEGGILTAVERIEHLLLDPSRPLAREWARTAFDLQLNPVLVQDQLGTAAGTRGKRDAGS